MGRTALITGGARRIGRAIVEDLAAHGWAVGIHCHRSVAEAEALAAMIRRQGGRAAVVQADLAEIAALPGLVAAATAELGPVDVLVNNASEFHQDALGSLEADAWNRQMTVNLAAPVFLAQAFAAALPPDRAGLIVNIADQRVWKPVPDYFSYQLSKSALWTATRTMAQALAPRIRVNAIGPGPSFRGPRQSEEDFRRQSEAVPLRAGPRPEEFGRAVRFFADMPSVTGQMVALDGGQHLAWQTPDVTGIPE
jgi:NAD(P)-dependent dehydrogenase (short-subunit alcohol dehydrogenase family)